MTVVEGQCFGCYEDSMFQYFGQTGNYNSRQVQLDYIAKLKKPSTTIDCVTCSRIVKYTEDNGKWTREYIERQYGIKCGGNYVKFNLDGTMRGSKKYGAIITESYMRKYPFDIQKAIESGIITLEEVK